MAVDHYENFPVASLLLPAHLRLAVRDIYRFARNADDLADEGDASPAERLKSLERYRQALHCIAGQKTADGFGEPEIDLVFAPLAQTIRRHQLPIEPFFNLISAFEQDVVTTRYQDETSLLDYCRRSANPVGRLMLHLYGVTDSVSMSQSDAICTALQLINFMQDVKIDWHKGRMYLPAEDIRRFGVTEQAIAAGDVGPNWQALMAFQHQRCQSLLHFGRPLGNSLQGRIGLELRLIIEGGQRILDKLQAAQFDVFHHRPTLSSIDWVTMFWRAIRSS